MSAAGQPAGGTGPATVVRTLAQVVADSDAAPPAGRCFFYDEDLLRAALPARDLVLYRAERDACPGRTVAAAGGGTLTWRLDRVTYPGEDLPTGELGRSVGHWNPPGQAEIFEVVQGEVAVLTTMSEADPVDLIRCPAGSVVSLRQGAWHLTYVLRGPAVVTNIYTEAPRPAPGKYFSGAAIRMGLRRNARGITTFAARPAPAISWQTAPSRQDMIGSLAGLAALLTSPTVPDMLKDPRLHRWERVSTQPGGPPISGSDPD